MNKCAICGKPATANCSQCGMPLCKNHVEHGIQFRTSDPTINCPNCKKKIAKLSKSLIIVLGAVFIVITIGVILYLNSVFSFIR
jgi:uncharacterized membrane protein YvbJ